jgi:hypothetical protein
MRSTAEQRQILQHVPVRPLRPPSPVGEVGQILAVLGQRRQGNLRIGGSDRDKHLHNG